jgi:hypothetical protein
MADDLGGSIKKVGESLAMGPFGPMIKAYSTAGDYVNKGLKAVGLMDESAGFPKPPAQNGNGSPAAITVGKPVEKE